MLIEVADRQQKRHVALVREPIDLGSKTIGLAVLVDWFVGSVAEADDLPAVLVLHALNDLVQHPVGLVRKRDVRRTRQDSEVIDLRRGHAESLPYRQVIVEKGAGDQGAVLLHREDHEDSWSSRHERRTDQVADASQHRRRRRPRDAWVPPPWAE